MDNEAEYDFSDFTTSHYIEILREAKNRYIFRSFEDFDENKKFAIMRHDVDFSPQRAMKFAEVEYNEGIVTTYFWNLHSEFYNLLDKDIFSIVKKIESLGHKFGIHLDTSFYSINNDEELETALENEKRIIDLVFNIQPKVFSFHSPRQFEMSCQKFRYANLVNAYAEYFQKNVKYCSDSNGYWRFDRMMDVVKSDEYSRLQLLTHAENWTDEVMSPFKRIERAINGRAAANIAFYNKFLADAGRKNIK